MKDLTKKVGDLYTARIKRVRELKKEVTTILKQYQKEQKEIIFQLKDLLAKKQSLRKKDFDLAMEKVLNHHQDKEKEIGERLSEFKQTEEQVAKKLKKLFSEEQKPTIDGLRSLAFSLQKKQRAKASEIRDLLTSLSNTHEETSKALKTLLEKGEKIKIKDFKKMVAQFKIQQAQKQDEIRRALLGFRSQFEEKISQLKEEASNGEMARKAKFEAIMVNILAGQEKRSRQVTGVLKNVRVMLGAFQEEKEQAGNRLQQVLLHKPKTKNQK